MPSLPLRIAAAVAILFGALTVVSGWRALFGGVDMGDVVAFVLWFNFLAGFAYVIAGIGLWQARVWGVKLSAAILVATGFVFAAFAIHILQGGAFEPRTLGAMILRTFVWAAISAAGWRSVTSRGAPQS
nr:hypothetical protein [Cribrihabitans marinus]